MTGQVEGQMSFVDLGISFGRTYPAHSQAERRREKTSESSLKKSHESPTRKPLFLDLRNGATVESSWVTDSPLLGGLSTRSFGEAPSTLMEECGFEALPNGVGVSRLSQTLVDTPLPKYSLSEKACLGILNRAARRGKELPKELKEVLERQATPSKLGGCEVDSSGKKAGKGALVQTEKAGTVAAAQDQTLIKVGTAVDIRHGTEDEWVNKTLQAKSNGGWNANSNNIVRV